MPNSLEEQFYSGDFQRLQEDLHRMYQDEMDSVRVSQEENARNMRMMEERVRQQMDGDVEKVSVPQAMWKLASDRTQYSPFQPEYTERQKMVEDVGHRVGDSLANTAGFATSLGVTALASSLVGGAVLPLGIGMAAYTGVNWLTSNIQDRLGVEEGYRSYLRETSHRYITPFESSNIFDPGFDSGQRSEVARYLRGFSATSGLEDDEVMEILESFTDADLLRTTHGVKSFQDQFEKLVEVVKDSAIILHSSYEEVVDMMGEFNRMGIDIEDFPLMMSRLRNVASFTGGDTMQTINDLIMGARGRVHGTPYDLSTAVERGELNTLLAQFLSDYGQEHTQGFIDNIGGVTQASETMSSVQEQILRSPQARGFGHIMFDYEDGEFTFNRTMANEFFRRMAAGEDINELVQVSGDQMGEIGMAQWQTQGGRLLTNLDVEDSLNFLVSLVDALRASNADLRELDTADLLRVQYNLDPNTAEMLGSQLDTFTDRGEGFLAHQRLQAYDDYISKEIERIRAGDVDDLGLIEGMFESASTTFSHAGESVSDWVRGLFGYVDRDFVPQQIYDYEDFDDYTEGLRDRYEEIFDYFSGVPDVEAIQDIFDRDEISISYNDWRRIREELSETGMLSLDQQQQLMRILEPHEDDERYDDLTRVNEIQRDRVRDIVGDFGRDYVLTPISPIVDDVRESFTIQDWMNVRDDMARTGEGLTTQQYIQLRRLLESGELTSDEEIRIRQLMRSYTEPDLSAGESFIQSFDRTRLWFGQVGHYLGLDIDSYERPELNMMRIHEDPEEFFALFREIQDRQEGVTLGDIESDLRDRHELLTEQREEAHEDFRDFVSDLIDVTIAMTPEDAAVFEEVLPRAIELGELTEDDAREIFQDLSGLVDFDFDVDHWAEQAVDISQRFRGLDEEIGVVEGHISALEIRIDEGASQAHAVLDALEMVRDVDDITPDINLASPLQRVGTIIPGLDLHPIQGSIRDVEKALSRYESGDLMPGDLELVLGEIITEWEGRLSRLPRQQLEKTITEISDATGIIDADEILGSDDVASTFLSQLITVQSQHQEAQVVPEDPESDGLVDTLDSHKDHLDYVLATLSKEIAMMREWTVWHYDRTVASLPTTRD